MPSQDKQRGPFDRANGLGLKYQSKVFNSIEPSLFQKIDQAEMPNKRYVKTRCDNCGAKCTNASDISPNGDLRCAYCNTWFNVLRT